MSEGGIYMKKKAYRLIPRIKGIRKDIARLIGLDISVLNVVKKCSADLQNWYSTTDFSARLSSPR